jgi:hypothetical protein
VKRADDESAPGDRREPKVAVPPEAIAQLAEAAKRVAAHLQGVERLTRHALRQPHYNPGLDRSLSDIAERNAATAGARAKKRPSHKKRQPSGGRRKVLRSKMERLKLILEHRTGSEPGRRKIAGTVGVSETLVRDCIELMKMGWDITESALRGVGESPNASDSPDPPTDFVIVPSIAQARKLLAKRRRQQHRAR